MGGRPQMDCSGRRKRKAELNKAQLDAELDRALAQTFPASDPYSVGRFTSTEPPARPVDRQAPEVSPAPAVPPRRPRKSGKSST